MEVIRLELPLDDRTAMHVADAVVAVLRPETGYSQIGWSAVDEAQALRHALAAGEPGRFRVSLTRAGDLRHAALALERDGCLRLVEPYEAPLAEELRRAVEAALAA